MFLRTFKLCLFFVVFVLAQHSCAWARDEEKNEDKSYNVVIIAINALRVDHLGVYGYPRNTSPNIDSLAQDGVIFDHAISQSYWTLPSLASLFTSKFVCAHNLDSRDKSLRLKDTTLAEILKGHGYNTMAFTCGLDTAAVYGLGKGFDIYDSYAGPDPVGSFSDIMPNVLEKLKVNKDRKFFLFLQSYDPHPPYRGWPDNAPDINYDGIFKREPLDYNTLKKIKGLKLYLEDKQIQLFDKDIDYIVARYDDGIRHADSLLGVFINELKELKLYDKTIIILCADHGEELGERGTFDRFGNKNLYQEIIHVPLIIRYPGALPNSRPAMVKSLVGLVDIMPTILDLLGIPQKEYRLQGKILSPLIKEGKKSEIRNFIVSEASKDKWVMLRRDGWKLMHSSEGNELYSLNDDAGEQMNLAGQRLDICSAMFRDFFLWREHIKEEDKVINRVELSSQLIENLKKAGYW